MFNEDIKKEQNEITKQRINYFSKAPPCEKEEHKYSYLKIQHENGQYFCWGCLSNEIYYNTRKNKSICNMCYGFVKDWLHLPLSQNDIFYKIQSTVSVQKFIPIFTHGLLQWLERIGELDDTILMSNIKKNYNIIYTNPEYVGVQEELIWAAGMLQACIESPFCDDIKYWIDIGTDYGVVYDYKDIPLWISLWFLRIWNTVPIIHAEHMGWRQVSYIGPAIGMTPLPLTVVTNTSSTPNVTNVSHPPVLFEQQEVCSCILSEEELIQEGLDVVDLNSENTV